MTPEADLAGAIAAARDLSAAGERRILGITGAPGAGKSTLARALVEALGDMARLVPMDGFHLANRQLERLGRRDRKGAPDTFDVRGYVALLRRLRDPGEAVVYAPEFHRGIEESFAAAIDVARDVPLVITEGNYLGLDAPGWDGVRPLLDAVWFVAADDALRLERLIRRHIEFGKPPDVARAWATGTDQRNADVVEATRGRADLLVRLD